MKRVFSELNRIMQSDKSIIQFADEIADLRGQLSSEEEFTKFVNLVREKVQDEATQAVIDNDGRGIVAMATGSGKSKVAINVAKYYAKQKKASHYDGNCLLVPTEKLRDENWKDEFEKWKAKAIFEKTERMCYASASKFESFDYYLAILDEGHNLTELSSEIFVNNNIEHVIVLTATPPTNNEKKKLFERLAIPIVYQLSLDDAVKLGFVAPYKINVVYTQLDEVNKNVKSGNKTNPFYQTEAQKYNYLSTQYENAPKYSKERFRASLNRMRFIYNLQSKTEAAKYILQNIVPKQNRTLIFCGSIPQANELCEHRFHSKTSDEDYNKFRNGEIDKMSCVQAINEGHNFVGIDDALATQINSNEKDLIQRIGRTIRYRFGHEAIIWILVCKNTQDEVWLNSAIENFDKSKVNFYSFEQIKNTNYDN